MDRSNNNNKCSEEELYLRKNKKCSDDHTLKKTISRWLYIAAVFLLAVLLLPLFLPVSCVLTFYRKTLVFVLKKLLGEDVMIVSGQDAVWLQDSANNKAIINSILIIKDQPIIEIYWRIMMERMVQRKDPDSPGLAKLKFPKLSMYTTRILRRYVWVKEKEFDIKEHVYFYDKHIPRTKMELQEVTGDIFSKGLPANKAPWEMVLIPPVEGQNEFILALRFHHCMGDGISLTKAFVHCATDNPPIELKARLRIGVNSKVYKVFQAIVQGPSLVVSRLLKPKDINILHGAIPTGKKCVAWGKQISLAMIKKMNRATKTTVNDVLLSCLAGSLADYVKRYSPSAIHTPQNMCASVPVDIRRSKELTMDNQFAIVFMDLPLDEDDPLTLLQRTKQRMDAIKQSPEPLVNHLVLASMMAQFPNVVAKHVIDWLSEKCSIVLSNVPGPTALMKVNNQVIEDLIFWPPQRKNVGVGISIMSYYDHLRIGVISDEAVLKEPAIITTNFFLRLERLACALKI